MSLSKDVFLFGYSGHSYVIIESLISTGYRIKGYFDLKENINNPYQIEYFGIENQEDLKDIVKDDLVFPSIGNNGIRKKLCELFLKHNLRQFNITDPSSNISKNINLGLSNYIGKNVIVNAQTSIGHGVILNSNCVIEHECKIKDYTHIAPASVLCGNVLIGENSFIGANSVIKENTIITRDVIIGAGSVVTKNINKPGKWYGNPVKHHE